MYLILFFGHLRDHSVQRGSPKDPSAWVLIGLPLKPPLRYTPQAAPQRSADREACFSQAFLCRWNGFVLVIVFSYYHSNHQSPKNRKLAPLKQAIFLTGFSIRILVLVLREMVSRYRLCPGSFGFAKHCYIRGTHLIL